MAVISKRSTDRQRTAPRRASSIGPRCAQAIYQIVARRRARRAVLRSSITNTAANLSAAEHRLRLRLPRPHGRLRHLPAPDRLLDTSMTYGRAFLVGLLNTLLVAGLGIVARHRSSASSIGIARLSTNWLVARLATVYVEIDPQRAAAAAAVLLVLRGAEEPAGAAAEPSRCRAASSSTCAASTCRRRCPSPASATVALALAGRHRRRPSPSRCWARRRQMLTGQRFPVLLDRRWR